MNQRKAGMILSYLQIFVSNTISLIYTPYMLRVMGQSEYGLFGTANSFISYLSLLSFGIGGAYMRFNARSRAAHDREEEKRINGMFLTVFSFLALLVFIGGIICILLAEPLVKNTFTSRELTRLRIIMFMLTINMIITFIFNVVSMALQAYEKYAFIRTVTLVSGIITPILNVIALNLGGRAVAISVISLFVSFFCYVVYFIYARHSIKLEFSFCGFDKGVMREIFIFSGYLFLNSITDQITFSTDNIILSAVKGTAAVAVYTVGANFKNYFQQFASGISGVFGPSIHMMVAQNRDMKALDELFIRVGRVQFYVVSLILIGYISIGQDFVSLWAGTEYHEAFYIGLMLMLSVFVTSFQSVGLEIQKALNKHKARSVVYFFIALLNVVLTIPFSQWWGGIGAAIATLICMILGSVIFMNLYYWKRIGLNIPAFWKSMCSILPGYICPIIVGLLMNRYVQLDRYLEILAAAVIISVVFAISIWKFSMNEYEKNLFREPIKKVIQHRRHT